MSIEHTADPALAAALRRTVDGRWAHVRERCRALQDDPSFAPEPGLDTAAHRTRVTTQLRAVADSGIPRMGFDPAYGGGGDVGGSVTAFEMLSSDLSLMVKVGVQWGLFGGALQALGTAWHHDRFLEPMMTGELLGCFAMTETGRGSDVQSLRTTATYDPGTGELVVHTPHEAARKDYIGNAARDARMAVVFAQLHTGGEGHGVHAVLVPLRDADGTVLPGITITDCGEKGGLNGVDNGRITFDHVRVPREHLLNRYGDIAADGTYTSPIDSDGKRFFTQLGTLVRGRASVAAGSANATKTALAIALRYAEVRRQFGRPGDERDVRLMDYRSHQRRLLPRLATTYALHFAQQELVSGLHDTETSDAPDEADRRELETRAAGIKALTTWHGTATIQAAREACGGAGYLAENQLPMLKADTDVFTTFEGDNTVLLQQVTKGLLTSFRDTIGDLTTIGQARFAVDQVVAATLERTAARALIQRLVAAAPGRGSDADLRDRGTQLALFEDRERHVLEGLVRRMRRRSSDGADGWEVFNQVQDHALTAARVHVERVVLEAFVAAIDRCRDTGARHLLSLVCDLHVASTLEADRAWFLEHGRLSPSRAKAVTQLVDDLCAELRPHTMTLVDGMGVPDVWITAPIATGAEAVRQEAQLAHDRAGTIAEPALAVGT